jgi:hypothetical protein
MGKFYSAMAIFASALFFCFGATLAVFADVEQVEQVLVADPDKDCDQTLDCKYTAHYKCGEGECGLDLFCECKRLRYSIWCHCTDDLLP